MLDPAKYPYLADILAQPQALEATAAALARQQVPALLRQSIEQRVPLILTGMGASYFALLPLYRRLLEAGITATLIETSELLLSGLHLKPGKTIIAISQSGESVEIVRLLSDRHTDVAVFGITNSRDSTLDRLATASLLMAAGKEAAVSTKTYLASLITLRWLGDAMLGGTSNLPAAAEAVAAYLSRWTGQVDQMSAFAQAIGNLFLVGRGDSLATAAAGALIMKESVRLPAEGLSGAAFRHGPLEMAAERGTVILVFTGTGDAVPLNERLTRDITAMGGRVVSVSPTAQSEPFRLPDVPAEFLPLVEILPVQLLTLAIGKARNMKAGEFRHMGKVTTIE
jgi:glutamine---fructose-6-phosphate transaminase (isomerizing)